MGGALATANAAAAILGGADTPTSAVGGMTNLLTANSLPFVIDSYERTGRVEATKSDDKTITVLPASGTVKGAYPLVFGVATFR